MFKIRLATWGESDSGDGAQAGECRVLPHGFADFAQFCPLLTAIWLAAQLPVWGNKGGDRRLEVRLRKSRLIGGGCRHVKEQQEARDELFPRMILSTRDIWI